MKTNVILKTMLVLLFVCGSAVLTGAGLLDRSDVYRSGNFLVKYWLESGLRVRNDDGLSQNTIVGGAYGRQVAITYCYNAVPGKGYTLNINNHTIGASTYPEIIFYDSFSDSERIYRAHE